jgi:competence protein ComEC
MVPLALAGWGATWLATSGARTAMLLGAVAAVLCCGSAVLRRSGWLAGLTMVVAVGLVVGAAHHYRLAHGPVSDLANGGAVAVAQLVTRNDPQLHPAAGAKPPYLSVRAVVTAIDGRGSAWKVHEPVLLVVTGAPIRDWAEIRAGTHISTGARLQQPVPGSDIAAVLRVRAPPRVTSRPTAPLRLVERVRSGLRTSVQHRSAEPRALVPALVLGDTSAMTTTITDDFQVTGLTHLTAVSGANLTLLLAFMLLVARWARVRGWWLRGVGLVGVIIFVALCRTEPSVLRAAAMGLVALVALGTGGGRAGLRTLSVAMLILLIIDPYLSRSLGFGLSVLASAGIVWWAAGWTRILHAWLPKFIAEAVAVPLAAHLATLPVVAAISGRVSVVGVLTNALAGPFVGPATVLGFAAAGLSLLNRTLASVAGFGAAWSAQLILWVAHAGARLPGASWHWPSTPGSLTLLGLAALVTGTAMPLLLSRPWLSLMLTLTLIAALLHSPTQPGWPPKGWVFVACDVGQGDGLAVRVAAGQAIVVDSGPDPVLIRRCLDQLGIKRVPLLILTHFHADHVDGLAGVLDHRRVGEIWVSPFSSPVGEATIVRTVAGQRGVPVRVPAMGERLQVGEVGGTVLGPVVAQNSAEAESAEQNDASLVVMVTVAGVRILLTGDVEPPGQEALVANGGDLHADVLKLPHHGSAQQDPAFIAGSHARVAVASAGLNNDYGHPAARTVRLVQSLGMTLLRTDTEGSVAITSRNGELAAVTSKRR